ncbi:hypothetical protein AGJ34_20360 [Cronobacter dublinensis subsp. dublinensis]|nr:hypothetical protein [Cronobacter dublinensis subsp. dublinensis]EGT5729939.1 hypothetical protein [Cronobacter dublinensis subsp. dublinensis]
MEKNEIEFFCGAFWAASVVFRSHGDSVVVKDLLNDLPNAHATAKASSEYDVQPLRLNVMNSLPLGCDAEYTAISYGPVSSRGELICDHKERNSLDEDEIDSYGVFGLLPDGTRLLLTSGMPEAEEAEGQAETLSVQLSELMTGRKNASPA